MFYRFARLYRTLKYLKLKQFCYFIIRRYLSLKEVQPVIVSLNQLAILELQAPLDINEQCAQNEFNFLNSKLSYDEASLDWMGNGQQRLWTYNLHYFDYLRNSQRFIHNKQFLISHWIEHNPQNKTPGWEPFTCSLRIVNWIFFSVTNNYQELDFLNSLYTQVLWLEKNDEKHILANHYFENLKALLFASYYFDTKDADRWFDYAVKNIAIEIDEQFFADGGHYERTPQYHSLMLENLLDIYNLISNNSARRTFNSTAKLRELIPLALALLDQIELPDNSLPMFNDTAQGIAPNYLELAGYAEMLGLTASDVPKKVFAYSETGLYGVKTTSSMFIIDAGDIGPDYQPGHTHCDMLSYELFVDGRRLIVDTGVAEYEPGPLRQYVRSTAAHNTVQIAECEQSEVWGEFRVGRRAKVVSATIKELVDKVIFDGEINGFGSLAGDIYHRRCCMLQTNNEGGFLALSVEDSVRGDSCKGLQYNMSSLLHLHPDVNFEVISPIKVILFLAGLKYELSIREDCIIEQQDCVYCPEFGISLNTVCLAITKNATMPSSISYKISKV